MKNIGEVIGVAIFCLIPLITFLAASLFAPEGEAQNIAINTAAGRFGIAVTQIFFGFIFVLYWKIFQKNRKP